MWNYVTICGCFGQMWNKFERVPEILCSEKWDRQTDGWKDRLKTQYLWLTAVAGFTYFIWFKVFLWIKLSYFHIFFCVSLRLTGGITSLPAVASQDGSGRGGQTLQGGRRQDLLWVKLWKLSKTLLKVRLRTHTSVFPAHKRTQRWNTVSKIPRDCLWMSRIFLMPSGWVVSGPLSSHHHSPTV